MKAKLNERVSLKFIGGLAGSVVCQQIYDEMPAVRS